MTEISSGNLNEFTRIRLRRANSYEWLEANPVLGLGEAGFETDTKLIKIGDGTGVWSSLEYVKVHPLSITFPTIQLGISDGIEQRMDIDLSANEPLTVIGSGGTTVSYNGYTNTLIIESLGSGGASLNRNHIIDALGYIPQISGSYSLLNHNHDISNISGLQVILDNKQQSGNYSLSNHTHTLRISDGSSDIIDYNIGESLKVIGSGYTSILFDNYTNSIIVYSSGNSGVVSLNNRVGNVTLSYPDITGAIGYIPQPLGSYSLSGHQHLFEQKTIPSSSYLGIPGEIYWDLSYLYICVNTNSWHRIAHSEW
jgi:hypothetical protein